jgi:hypothetical protein
MRLLLALRALVAVGAAHGRNRTTYGPRLEVEKAGGEWQGQSVSATPITTGGGARDSRRFGHGLRPDEQLNLLKRGA